MYKLLFNQTLLILVSKPCQSLKIPLFHCAPKVTRSVVCVIKIQYLYLNKKRMNSISSIAIKQSRNSFGIKIYFQFKILRILTNTLFVTVIFSNNT